MKLAFIGANGHRLLTKLLSQPDAHNITEVAYAADHLDPALARAACDTLNKTFPCQWFDDHRHMLETFKPTVVNLGVRYGHNGSYAASILERDIPVCSDKPIAATWQQYDQLVKLTQGQPQRTLVSEFPMRCGPAYLAAKAAIVRGDIGSVVLATAQKSYKFGTRPDWYASRQDYGGTILWVASHAIDYLHFVTGQAYTAVSGVTGNVSKADYPDMEEYTLNTFTLANGGAAVVHADYNRPASAPTHGDDRLRVVGSQGQLEIIGARCTLTTHDQPPVDITDQASSPPVEEVLLDALMNQGNATYSTQASLNMARVLLKARDAADQHTTVTIDM